MPRLNRKARMRKRRDRLDQVARDATMLPTSGHIADLVARIGRELDLCVAAGRASFEAAPFLHPLGLEAFQAMGSIRGMRAVCHRAAGLDPERAEIRRDMLDKAWHGVGDERGVWKA